eukprot:1160760-Pelagomonas_calceolata.AAC.13
MVAAVAEAGAPEGVGAAVLDADDDGGGGKGTQVLGRAVAVLGTVVGGTVGCCSGWAAGLD